MITVDRSIHIEGASDADGVGAVVAYASLQDNVLLEAVSTLSGEYYFRRSEDNGKTWQRTEEEWVASESLAPHLQLNRGLLGFWFRPHQRLAVPRLLGKPGYSRHSLLEPAISCGAHAALFNQGWVTVEEQTTRHTCFDSTGGH